MELEQLKEMWKKQETGQVSTEVQPLLSRRSNTPIAKMKRHLVIELIAVILLYGFVISFYFFNRDGKFMSISVLYFIIGSLFCIYFYRKFKLLSEMECMACEVKSNLSKQVATLEKYIRFYLLAGTAIIPVVMIFFYWFEFKYASGGKGIFFLLPSEGVSVLRSIGSLLLWTIPTTILFYFINKWYVRKLYGRYVESLKEMLSQMEDTPQYS